LTGQAQCHPVVWEFSGGRRFHFTDTSGNELGV